MPTPTISFATALRFWFKLGCISFGGPAGQIALMHRELVEEKRWISEPRFTHALNYCMLLPGPEAQQLATYLGWLMHGRLGGIAAGALFILPSLIILLAVSGLYVHYGNVGWVAAVLYGIKPAVTAIVVQAVYKLGRRTLRRGVLLALAGSGLLGSYLGVPFPLLVAVAALLGWALARYAPTYWPAASIGHAAAAEPAESAAPLSAQAVHTRWRPRSVLAVALTGLGLWAATLAALYLWAAPLYTQLGWFFTKAALLTFGGAYAVLPYVYQGAVQHFGWLSAGQMLDGLALGESTPGPLIMVVTFVGFLAGFQTASGGQDPWLLALGAALCVTWFTFLPSFVFILVGAPLVEASRQIRSLQAPLLSISALVVGVMLNLALFFAGHVFWPQGFSAWPDVTALGLGLLAAWALLRWQWSVPRVLVLAAGLGLLRHAFGG
ncbi:chromate efflux transporter [Chitinibacter tainanensis]|uniref:chromate efflux transporter n=1 Tax=Chitinibacter tainanensis TaxID=230667 RepID=UPI00041682EA|nr:chromate efflux transporter [Chitinibacter tainanensis]